MKNEIAYFKLTEDEQQAVSSAFALLGLLEWSIFIKANQEKSIVFTQDFFYIKDPEGHNSTKVLKSSVVLYKGLLEHFKVLAARMKEETTG